jgi:hypothetical protein
MTDLKLTMSLSYGPRKVFKGQTFGSLADAQIAYVDARDLSGFGASDWGSGKVRQGSKPFALISYNGRAWTKDGKTLLAELPNQEVAQ